jgi:glycosyltransferase involved in cell wall biosynthesis
VSVVLSHPTGNTFVRATAQALHARGWLHSFHTTLLAPERRTLALLPGAIGRQAARRRFDEIPRDRIRTRCWRESVRLAPATAGVDRWMGNGGFASVDAVYRDLDCHVARSLARLPASERVTAVYAYEDGAERTFAAARAQGIGCAYELPIAYWRTTQRLLREEAERLPAWRATLRGIDDPAEKLERKDRELALADVVIVPSRFVYDSLPTDVRGTKHCVVAQFGAPPTRSAPVETSQRGVKLRVLFAGALTQRKGLADLFAAMRLIGRSDVELVVMGTPVAEPSFYRQQFDAFTYEAPRPHADVLALMRTCDVLALPAIVEGRALVQQEALASGLPLIVTRNAGADDLVHEGRTGFLVPIRSPEAVADRIAWCADHRAQLTDMRHEAMRVAQETRWSQYAERVCDAVIAAQSGAAVKGCA